jgi:hypothetical protein
VAQKTLLKELYCSFISWIHYNRYLPLLITNASGEQVASTHTMPAPQIDVSVEGAIIFDDDSPLTTASGEVLQQPPWDDQ